MEEEAVVFFDLLPVPEDVQSVIRIQYWGDMVFKKQRLLDYARQTFKKFNNIKFFHVRTDKDFASVIDHFKLTQYKRYFFYNSSFTIIDEELFSEFLQKIRYIPESLALYKDNEIRSFLRLNKTEMLSLLGLLKSDPTQLANHLKINFDTKVERFRLEQFFIDIRDYLDFVQFLHSNFTPRYFNAIERKDDVITKRSPDKAKMKMEYSYYHVIPEELRYFFLPTFGYKETEEFAQYSIERFSIPDLAIQWIHFSITDNQFEKLLKRLFGFIKARPSRKLDSATMIAKADKLYAGKVASRFKQLQEKPVFEKLQKIFPSCTAYPSIDAMYARFQTLFEKHKSSKSFAQQQTIGHGDFCFSNILYDKRINLLKLIDPKGSLTLEDAYMDEYYDIAKLSHSILGNYDFINNGLYEITYDQKLQATIDIKSIATLEPRKALFRKYLKDAGYDYTLVRVCELSLFLSMTPLHVDTEKNVLAFLLNAAAMIDEIETPLV